MQNELGLEAFEIEPGGEAGSGPTVTIGGELAPGLVARFSRQFGQESWNEATIEYYLSRLFRHSRDVFRRPVDDRALGVPPGGARRHRLLVFFSF